MCETYDLLFFALSPLAFLALGCSLAERSPKGIHLGVNQFAGSAVLVIIHALVFLHDLTDNAGRYAFVLQSLYNLVGLVRPARDNQCALAYRRIWINFKKITHLFYHVLNDDLLNVW